MARPKKTEGKRVKKIDVRFTDEEYFLIESLENTLGVSKTELIRNRLLKDAHHTIINAKEMIKALDGIGAELGRAGNNINQLARYANVLNKDDLLSPVIFERFNLLFELYIANQKTLDTTLRTAIRLLNNP